MPICLDLPLGTRPQRGQILDRLKKLDTVLAGLAARLEDSELPVAEIKLLHAERNLRIEEVVDLLGQLDD